VVGTAVGTGREPRPCPRIAAQDLVMNVTKDVESNDCVCSIFVMDACEYISMVSVDPESSSQAIQIPDPRSAQLQRGVSTGHEHC